MSSTVPGFPPQSVTVTLRLEGVAAAAAAISAYAVMGGNWWVFLLLLAPDLSFLGYLAGAKTGARIYNLAHTYVVPALLGAVGWFGGVPLLVEIALVWTAHIGMDRMLGYGLKYPDAFQHTHLGRIGKTKA